MKQADKLSEVYVNELQKIQKLMPNLDKAVEDIQQIATSQIDRLLFANLERLMKEMKQEYKRDFKVIFGMGTWSLTDLQTKETYGVFRAPDDTVYDDEISLIDKLDTIAQDNKTCLPDYSTVGK